MDHHLTGTICPLCLEPEQNYYNTQVNCYKHKYNSGVVARLECAPNTLHNAHPGSNIRHKTCHNPHE